MRKVTSIFIGTLLGLVILSITVLAVSAVPARGIQSRSNETTQQTAPHAGSFTQPTVIHDESTIQSLPVLTDEQREQAATIALDDQRVRNLLDGHPAEVTDIVMVTGEQSHLIGAVVSVSFSKPTTVDGEWLSLSWSCDQQPLPPPTRVPYNARFGGVTSIHVFSNLTTGEVDQISPFVDGGVTLIGERVFTGETTSITSCYGD